MEYTQWVEKGDVFQVFGKVLILVVMEYTQWDDKDYNRRLFAQS